MPFFRQDDRSRLRVAFRLIPLNILIFLGFMIIGMPLPVLPLFVRATMSPEPLLAGMVIGLQSLVTVLTRHHAGQLADRKGPRTATMRGLVLCAVAGTFYVAAALLSIPWPGRLLVLLTGRAILGLGESLILTGAIAWGIGRAGAGNTGTVLSWNGIAMYLALAIGAPLGLGIYQEMREEISGLVVLGIISAMLPAAAGLYAFFLPDVGIAPADPIATRAVLRRILPYGSVLTLQMMGFGTIASFLSLAYAAEGWSGAGAAFTGFGIGVVVVRLLWGHLPDRVGGRSIAALSLLVDCVGQMVIWLAPIPAVAAVGAILTGMGLALAFPALGLEAMRRLPSGSKGLAVGLFSAFQDIAFGITGPLAGLLAELAGTRAVFAAGAAAAIIALCVLSGIRQGGRR